MDKPPTTMSIDPNARTSTQREPRTVESRHVADIAPHQRDRTTKQRTRSRLLFVVVATVLAVAGFVVWRAVTEPTSAWWHTIERVSDFAGADHRGLNRLAESVSNGEVAVSAGRSTTSPFDRGVVVTDLASGQTDYVPLIAASTTRCVEPFQPDVCGDPVDEVRLTVGPVGFVAEFVWQNSAHRTWSRQVAWSPDGVFWRGLDPTDTESVVIAGQDGVYEIRSSTIERLDTPAEPLDTPWSPDSEIWSSTATAEATAILVDDADGLGVWTLSSNTWQRRNIDTIDDHVEFDSMRRRDLTLITSQNRVFLVNLAEADARSVSAGATTYPLGWATSDGHFWTPVEFPIAPSLSHTNRSIRHVGPDRISVVFDHDNFESSVCFGSSHPCASIPSFVAHIEDQGESITNGRARLPRGPYPESGTVLTVTETRDTRLLRTVTDDGPSTTIVDVAFEPFDTDRWFDLDWRDPLTDIAELDDNLTPVAASWNGHGFRLRNVDGAFLTLLMPLDASIDPRTLIEQFLIRTRNDTVVELFTYPDREPIGTFTFQTDS